MKSTWKTKIFSIVLCLALLIGCLPISAFAEATETEIAMTEGDVIAGFVPAGTVCTSSDPSIAWVDAEGSLNALKPGVVTVSAEGQPEYTVTVGDYSDGSPIVGNLKILARYNDNMQFYDGHVYLLFTSYQDGVEITVPDLYAGYEIEPYYYPNINEDISVGSNHSGADADTYFTFNDEMTSVTLNRGEIVTIGMYRDFDLTVPQAALGSIQNCSLWKDLSSVAKASIIEAVFGFLNNRGMPSGEAIARIKTIIEEEGGDYTKMLDGVVDGGVCFNRELYNQKLAWDQYENVTYEMDITENQLRMMTLYLGGNLNNFSILKNSCATVALRAWNAAVGTRNGAPTAYYLSAVGEGIFALIDAPKSVRDGIVSRLPGYYLNNAEGVAEPDAGYQDETGWVYVSAPEKVSPLSFNYDDSTVVIDEDENDIHELLKAAIAGKGVYYDIDEQEIGVSFNTSASGDATVINSINFTVNGAVYSVGNSDLPENGLWLRYDTGDLSEDASYYATDADGKAYASYYFDGNLRFRVDSLPASYKVERSAEGTKNLLWINIENGDKVDATTEIYIKDGDTKIPLENGVELSSGTKIYVKAALAETECDYILEMIALDYQPILSDDNYDEEEQAYFGFMPVNCAYVDVIYEKASVDTGEAGSLFQLAVGETLNVFDAAVLRLGDDDDAQYDGLEWSDTLDPDGAVEINGSELTAVNPGKAVVWVNAIGNENIGVFVVVEVYDSAEDMVKLTFSDETFDNTEMYVSFDGTKIYVPFSGYLVKKGSELSVDPDPDDGKAVLYLHANDRTIWPGEPFILTEDTVVDIKCIDAEIKNMPDEVRLDAKGDTYQLGAELKYTGLYSLIPVYDPTVIYICSADSVVSVDDSGLITVTGEVPEEGAAAYVTAYDASGAVFAITKVTVGDYQGDRIVGSITVSARRINKNEITPHGCLTFTTYKDIDMDISYYEFNEPNEKYNELMIDYEKNPENYSSDPALCNDNELGIENRESYFNNDYRGAMSEPKTISLLAGESISVSNYSFDATHMSLLELSLQGSISSSPEVQELIRQMKLYEQGEEIDTDASFNGLMKTLIYMYMGVKVSGHNPADGHSIGGLVVDREIYNQFRRNDSQTPNYYYTVEITADELAILQACLADPENNYYNLFNMNCASGVVKMWNTVLADSPELKLSANMSGLVIDPESLYFDIGSLYLKKCADPSRRGTGGTDFYPRTVRYSDALLNVMVLIDAIGEVEYTDECKEKIGAVREAYEALSDPEKERVRNYDVLITAEQAYDALAQETALLGDTDGDGKVTILDATAIQRHLASLPTTAYNEMAADADEDSKVTILDATAIQRYLANLPTNPNIGNPIA